MEVRLYHRWCCSASVVIKARCCSCRYGVVAPMWCCRCSPYKQRPISSALGIRACPASGKSSPAPLTIQLNSFTGTQHTHKHKHKLRLKLKHTKQASGRPSQSPIKLIYLLNIINLRSTGTQQQIISLERDHLSPLLARNHPLQW